MICQELVSAVWSGIMPVVAITTFITSIVIVLCYYLGEAMGHPRITLWAKTEIVQLLVSVFAAVLLFTAIQSFCSIDAMSLSSFVTQKTFAPLTIYDSAYQYLFKTSEFAHNTMVIERFYLGAFNLLEGRHYWNCQYTGCNSLLCCLFGTSGMSSSPYAYASVISVSFNIAFNTTVFSYLSALNYLFILKYAYSGILLFMLPLGIILRATPFMRNVGSLLIAVCIAFMIVYPTILSMFYILTQSEESVFFNFENYISPNNANLVYAQSENQLSKVGTAVINDLTRLLGSLVTLDGLIPIGGLFPSGSYAGEVFFNGMYEVDALKLAGKSFLMAVFFPTLALLGAIASVKYVSKMLGEDIDLSRIIQMV